MRTVFEFGSYESSEPGAPPLLCELGTEYFLMAALRNEQPVFLRLWNFAETASAESLQTIVQNLNTEGIRAPATIIALALPEMLLVPQAYENEAEALLPALYPLPAHTLLHDDVADKNLLVQYALAEQLHTLLNDSFSSLTLVHACTPALHQPPAQPDALELFFVNNQFRVMVYRNDQLLLAQQYGYSVPLDVVYYLLKICSEFSLSQQEVPVQVSGFVTETSPLYKELQQYFRLVHFSAEGELTVQDQLFPKHYFTSLYNLAACASSVVH